MKPADDSDSPRMSKTRRRELLASVEAVAHRFQSEIITDDEANRLCRDLSDLLSNGVRVGKLGPATRLIVALVKRSAKPNADDDDGKALAEAFAEMAKSRFSGGTRDPL